MFMPPFAAQHAFHPAMGGTQPGAALPAPLPQAGNDAELIARRDL
jgi:hypothetical protein